MKKWIVSSLLVLFGAGLVGCTSKDMVDKKESKADSEPVEIYLVRHGKTMFNTTGQVQGWADSPLTEVGIEQADSAGKGLSDIPFTLAYSSDMGRARATAQHILDQNESTKTKDLRIKELMGLREWGYGGYEGRDDAELWTPLFNEKNIPFKKDWSTWEDLTNAMTDEEMADAIAKNDPTQTAETYAEIVERSKAAIEEIVSESEKNGGGKVLAVSHGSEIPTILSIYTPDEYHGESIGNASVTILTYNKGVYSLKTIGDQSYLEK